MPVFRYRAFDANGRARKGTLDEDSRVSALDRLKQQGLVPVDVAQESGVGAPESSGTGLAARVGAVRRRVSLRDVALFTRQLSTLVGAGLTLVEALNASLEQAEQSRMQSVIAGVRDSVNEGMSFAEALKRHPGAFNDLYVNMVRAGEQSGTLEIVLERLADFLDGQIELRNEITGSLAYPVIMFLAMMMVVGILFIYVIPKIVEVFEQTGQALPLPTRVLIATTEFARNNGILLVVAVVLLIAGVRWALNTERGRAFWDRLRLDLPVVGLLARNVAMSRFSRTLSTLLASGVPLPTSLRIVREVVGNTVYAEAIDEVHDAVVEGGGLAAPLRRTGHFPVAMVRMVAAGEQSGELEDMLGRVANAYDREVTTRITIVTRLLEPLMIIMMGGLVFFIMLSILIPMFQINQIVG